jgi:hypothetical protein
VRPQTIPPRDGWRARAARPNQIVQMSSGLPCLYAKKGQKVDFYFFPLYIDLQIR